MPHIRERACSQSDPGETQLHHRRTASDGRRVLFSPVDVDTTDLRVMRKREWSCSCCVGRFYHVSCVLCLAALAVLDTSPDCLAPEWPRHSTAGTPEGHADAGLPGSPHRQCCFRFARRLATPRQRAAGRRSVREGLPSPYRRLGLVAHSSDEDDLVADPTAARARADAEFARSEARFAEPSRASAALTRCV